MRTKITTNLFWMSAMFVIAVITYVVVYTYEVQDEALTYQRWVDHSREVLLTTEKITGTFESTLAEQRGYLLTADKAFEEGFRIKGKTVVASLDKLSALTKDNFEQHARVEQLQDIAAIYTKLLDGRSQKYSYVPGRGAVLLFNDAYYTDRQQIRLMHDSFIKTIDRFLIVEHSILTERLRTYNDLRHETVERFIASLITACFLILFVNWIALTSQRKWLVERARYQNIDDRYGIAIKATNDGIFDWDMSGERVFLSSQIFRMCGYDLNDYDGLLTDLPAFMQGQNPFDLIHPNDVENLQRSLALFEEGNLTEYNIVFRIRHAQGHWVWVHARGSGLFKGAGKPRRLIGSHTDITVAKLMEERLRAEKEAADNSSKMKMEFMSHMSHEIRTPLTTINGAAEILVRSSENFNDRDKALVRTLSASASMLRELINDILDFSRIESGDLGLVKEPVKVGDVFEQIVDILATQAQEKNIALISQHNNLAAVLFEGDEARIRQIMLNLVSNAVKFTDKGSVTLIPSLQMLDKAAHRAELQIDIIDTGIGIQEKDMERIFERFYQADSTISKKYKGTGLGLAISKRLAEAMGGTISVKVTPLGGSTFTLCLPVTLLNPEVVNAAMAKGNVEALIPAVQHKEAPILLVEDYEGNILVISCLLEDMGYTCDVARNGEIAVDMVKNREYGAVLMDIQMPVMDGLTATTQIRAHESTTQRRKFRHVPIIGMTAHATQKDREKCMASGMDAYLAKPINRAEFESVIKEFVPGSMRSTKDKQKA